MATIAGAAAATIIARKADATGYRDSDPLLSTNVEGDDAEPMSERIPSKIRARGATTPNAPRTSPPSSRRPVDVSNGAPNPASHAHLVYNVNVADRKRHRLALVWSYAPDWFVLHCLSPVDTFWRTFFNVHATCEAAPTSLTASSQ
jgi:hypothetical protein